MGRESTRGSLVVTKRQARKPAYDAGYRSQFELRVATWMTDNGINIPYESEKLKYTIPEQIHTYTPDWTSGKYLYEGKGFFTGKDRKKMLYVREANPDKVIRMIFQNARQKLSKVSKTSYADWCDKNEIEWADFINDKERIKEWLKPPSKRTKKKV